MPLPPAPRPRIHHGDRHWGTKLKHMQLRESSSHSLQAIIAPSTGCRGEEECPLLIPKTRPCHVAPICNDLACQEAQRPARCCQYYASK